MAFVKKELAGIGIRKRVSVIIWPYQLVTRSSEGQKDCKEEQESSKVRYESFILWKEKTSLWLLIYYYNYPVHSQNLKHKLLPIKLDFFPPSEFKVATNATSNGFCG